MNDILDAIVLYDDLQPAQRTAFHEALASNPQLSQLFAQWRQLHREVRQNLSASLPDRDLLVLYALSLDEPEALTQVERSHLENSSAIIRDALEKHPGLNDVVRSIQSARNDFLSSWNKSARIDRPASPRNAMSIAWPTRAPILSIAAGFTLLALALSAIFFVWRNQTTEIVKTRAGEFRVIELVDGSTVRLYEKSKISYRKTSLPDAFDRSIYLNGRAFFDIVPASEPFIVETPTALTTATGTRFSIDASRSLTEVVLTHGQVSVDSKRRSGHVVTLLPGQYSHIGRRVVPSEPALVENLTEKLSWTGLAVFSNTRLDDVAAHFSQYYGLPLTVSLELASERINASFDPDTLSVEELLGTLTTAFGAQSTPTADGGFYIE